MGREASLGDPQAAWPASWLTKSIIYFFFEDTASLSAKLLKTPYGVPPPQPLGAALVDPLELALVDPLELALLDV